MEKAIHIRHQLILDLLPLMTQEELEDISKKALDRRLDIYMGINKRRQKESENIAK